MLNGIVDESACSSGIVVHLLSGTVDESACSVA